MVLNPLARRRRLGRALFELRTKRGLDGVGLARKSGVTGSVISRLESPLSEIGRKPNLLTVRRLLDALEVPRDGALFAEIEGYAEIGAGRGWWEAPAYARMGAGQRGYAVVEAGASEIREYAGLLLPGLVQTAAYTRHRAQVDAAADVDAIVAGRLERQRRAADATYRLILEEQAVRRLPAPPAESREQLFHLLELAERSNVSIRIVPVDARLGDGIAPRAPFAHMTYPSDDPQIVIVDNEMAAGHLVEAVDGYAQLHTRLCDGALSDADSASLIRSVANSLA